MGFFSWITQDTKRSVANVHSSKETFPVYLLDDKGNIWKENHYNGYGDFRGKDYFELLAEMNGFTEQDAVEKNCELRDLGIFIKGENIKYPNIVENILLWKWKNEEPKSCYDQGFFYD
ncbi:hypothetical protein [Flammeovirga sp. SJP92]|uniref:hypothetical protein n=1 Tax=Flammeovirga sp. SJP92 TaxID=1775430 RepID=UPI0007875E53|nr:hypothetical protein [Flammeovirga sp. SJP92]KXX68894.1 hypothetical protein AVL50_17185 [Flammeovirga sp. SJP92]